MDFVHSEAWVIALSVFGVLGLGIAAVMVTSEWRADDHASASCQPDRRADPRSFVSIPAVVTSGGQKFACKIVDLSERGAKLECESPCFLIRDVKLEWGDGSGVSCQVMRTGKTSVSVRFLVRVPLATQGEQQRGKQQTRNLAAA